MERRAWWNDSRSPFVVTRGTCVSVAIRTRNGRTDEDTGSPLPGVPPRGRTRFAAAIGPAVAVAVVAVVFALARLLAHDEILLSVVVVGPLLGRWYREWFRPRRVVASLAATIARRDRDTGTHCERVAAHSRRIVRALGTVSREEEEAIVLAARVHDLGKIAVPEPVLHKAAPLTAAEQAQVRAHPLIGAAMLRDLGEAETLCAVVRWHHERYAGGGYPDNLRGEEIPLAARVVAVADAWDAMLTDRPYRDATRMFEARDELLRCRGTHFDPTIVDAFVRSLDTAAEAETHPLYVSPRFLPA